MKIIEVGTGYTSIPAKIGAATEIVAEELTKAFLHTDNDVILIDIADSKRSNNSLPITEVKIPAFLESTDVQLGITHKLKRVIYSLALTKKLKKIIKESKNELLIHFHNQYNLYFFLKLTGRNLKRKVKIAYTVHSYIWAEEWNKICKTVHKRYFQEICCVQNADYVLVLNDKTAEHFTQHLGIHKEKIFKVANGVNADTYSVLGKDKIGDFKRSVGLEEKHIILQVGSVCDRKNQLGAVRMLSEYLKSRRDIIYMYAGGIIDDEYKALIDKFAKENNIASQVKYIGELPPGEKLNEYYNAAEMTVFPSKVESFGLVIIESLSTGTPVIVPNTPLFKLNTGYFIFNSADEFIDVVDGNIGGQNKCNQNRTETIKKYSWAAVARQHLEIFGN